MSSSARDLADVCGCWAFVALGSNLGDSVETVASAMHELQKFSAAPILKSSLWRTTPVDCPPGSASFVNAAVGLLPVPGETPESLLGKLKRMEEQYGRQPKKVLNEARPLDLDLIVFGNERRTATELTLPHPRAHQRRFVLMPLEEIAPELKLPGIKDADVRTLLERLPPDEQIERILRAPQ